MFGTDNSEDAAYERRREQLVDRLAESGQISDAATLDALRAVPRHLFVPDNRRESAYADRPLPIGDDQTISAPHMVGIMAELLDVGPGDDVLEIGTGCGYHAAVTAELVGAEHVYSVEYSAALAERARETLAELGYGDVSIRVDDGRDGWAEHAPYDAAYLTCAAPELPDAVGAQLREGGVALAPIGTRRQTLCRYRKRSDGEFDIQDRGSVRFVRLRG
ncbi:protein-L-isoaspartate(D-aspartate) O-methyltransferase [Natronoarchaeum philippinense]|uniref:Protein-L-isoaspartate O-methyltransferase n=1 Tax=Natronoarchaeum philippinense TaxID=558529 RepID=A0A285NBU2_NATPI|nr:protein-L-isoaspartate(D-aspartate) O-methyltransferase [Natronoarchaeum philippinense]SNZ06748.1 protein-L-isoaspartate(D-aspartate) O-methyltransferase [Natronoarchaeum philippinense]